MSLIQFKKLKSLLMKSAVLEREIEEESRRKNPNWIRLLTLKKQRLLVKDTLRRMRHKKADVSYS